MTDKYNDFVAHQKAKAKNDKYLNTMKDRLNSYVSLKTNTRPSLITHTKKRIGKYMEANYPLITN